MLAKYYEYNCIDPIIGSFISRMNELKYRYYASDLLNRMMQTEDFDLDTSVRKAIAILRLTGVPVQKHFSCVYRSTLLGMRRDWKMSELGCSLVIISAKPENQNIEEMQYALLHYLGF